MNGEIVVSWLPGSRLGTPQDRERQRNRRNQSNKERVWSLESTSEASFDWRRCSDKDLVASCTCHPPCASSSRACSPCATPYNYIPALKIKKVFSDAFRFLRTDDVHRHRIGSTVGIGTVFSFHNNEESRKKERERENTTFSARHQQTSTFIIYIFFFLIFNTNGKRTITPTSNLNLPLDI